MTDDAQWLEQLARAPRSERASLLEGLVAAEFRAWLLMGAAERLPLEESYFELGLTSLGATEIQERLEAALGRRIDSASLFNNPTVGHLLLHLRTEVLADLFGDASAAVERAAGSVVERASPKALLSDLLDELYES